MALNLTEAKLRLEKNEAVIKELMSKVEAYQIENKQYKDYCEVLEKRLESSQPQEIAHENNVKDDYNKIQESISIIRESFVDIDATEICSKIECFLNESNEMLDDNNIKETIEYLVVNLLNLIVIQYNSKDVTRLTKVKDTFIFKFDMIQKRLNKLNELSESNKTMRANNDKLKTEYETLKSRVSCKNVIENDQVDIISSELEKCRNEMKNLQNKVIDQNVVIEKLMDRLSKLIDLKEESTKDSVESDQHEISPTDSLTGGFYNTLQPTISQIVSSFVHLGVEAPPVPRPRQVSPQLQSNKPDFIQCHKCNLQVSSDFDFDIFREHVNKCGPNKSSCMFCLQVFDENQYDLYVEHVTSQHN